MLKCLPVSVLLALLVQGSSANGDDAKKKMAEDYLTTSGLNNTDLTVQWNTEQKAMPSLGLWDTIQNLSSLVVTAGVLRLSFNGTKVSGNTVNASCQLVGNFTLANRDLTRYLKSGYSLLNQTRGIREIKQNTWAYVSDGNLKAVKDCELYIDNSEIVVKADLGLIGWFNQNMMGVVEDAIKKCIVETPPESVPCGGD